ncbi:interaptin-like [Watersipora subatra]|uniref:interaptin-like n=1 Tax=Watersipora subatra TaxID=2589382 RepID=UPI00355B9F92
MAPHNVVVIYKEWVNSVLCEEGIEIRSIGQLSTQGLLLRLYQILTLEKDEADLKFYDGIIQTNELESIAILLRLLRADGVRTNLQPSDIANGDFPAILELVWLLLLNYGIHQRGESASQQRTTSIGTKLLLRWCSELLGGACFDYRLSMTENMEKDVLHNIINQVTSLVSKPNEPEPCDYHEAIADAERKLGVSSNLLRAYDTQTENLAVTVYISLLRRKRELILSGHSPSRPSVLVNQQPQVIPERPRSNLSAHNDKTQKMLKDIQKQLDVYHNGTNGSFSQRREEIVYSDRSLKAESSRDHSPASSIQSRVPSTNSSGTILSTTMPSPIGRAHGSFPNDTSDSLMIDLSALQQSDRKSCSTTTTPRKNADGISQQTAEFTALLRQLREEVSAQRDESDDEEDDRTSPKSAPNTDEGFGTFTKTTPRGKDSASEGSDDHTDCDVDHLTTPEPGSITEWWDRIEMPSVEVTAVDASLFKSASKELPRLDEDGRLEMADDELMCMIDSIGMNGIKASSGLVSAQETELRLLYILKERDDLVLSYHGALKELSKLTARMRDENHLLRQRLNMTDLSHNEIVLALEEQASDGRKLALGLQDDLTDTEVNILSQLREDKQVLQDRLAALEQQYEEDVQKWHEAGYSPGNDSEEGAMRRENTMLRLQLEEQRKLFDVTVSQAQDECSSYLVTIDKLKSELSNNASPISGTQLDALATRQADMEKLYESMVGSLEGDNQKLQAEVEQLQGEVTTLKVEKETRDENCRNCGVGTDSTELVNRSANTSFSNCSKSTETSAAQQAVKSTITDTDQERVSLQLQVQQLEEAIVRGNADQDSLRQQKSGLLDNHKQLSERLVDVESQLQITRQKLTALQAIHEIALSKNESLSRDLSESSDRLTAQVTSKERLQLQLSAQLEKASEDSVKLSSEVASTRQQLVVLQAECAASRQREVDMTAELTKLTQERSHLQAKVNSLNSDLVNQKAQHVSQSMKVQQLEVAKANMESQMAEFKRESVDLFEKLEAARQEKDDLSQQLNSLHSQLSESMTDWKSQLATQSAQHQQMRSGMESEIAAARSNAELYKSESDRLSMELGDLRQQLRDAHNVSDGVKLELRGLLKTAKLDEKADDAVAQLHEQLKALQKETAEYKFTTTHFRTENGQLQLRVNQLEEMNRSIEERNKILQADLTAVQTSLDDSYTSADAQLNLLDVSAADIMSINDASQLRDYILAAKRQVEMMQSKRAKSNIEYSRKIFEMEKLMKEKQGDSSEAPSCTGSASIKSTIDSKSAATDYAGLPESFTLNNSSLLAASLHNDTNHVSGDSLLMHSKKIDNLPRVPESGSSTPLHSYPTHHSHMAPNNVQKHSVLPAEAEHTLHKLTTGHSSGYPVDMPQQVAGASSSTHSQHLKLRYIPSHNSHVKVNDFHSPKPHATTEQARKFPPDNLQVPSDISDIDLASSHDSLSLKVRSLTNRPGTSTPTKNHVLGTSYQSGREGARMSAIESENAALKAELDILNTDRNSLHKQMKKQTVHHDVLNDTLDELERSLEEVCDSNRLLRDTLGDCNDYIQSNILSEPSSSPRSSRNLDTSAKSGHGRPHSTVPASRARSVTPAAARSRSMTPAIRPRNVTPSRPYSSTSRLTPHSVTFAPTPSTNQESVGWSSQSDHQMTSSYDFNKLQQTNVQNYSSLLHSEMNSKSPSHRSTTDRKSTDLNQMIRHSLGKLNQVNSTGSTSPSLSTGYTSTPLRSSRSSVYSSLPGTSDATDSEVSGPYITANQDVAISAPYHNSLHPFDSRGPHTSFDSLRYREQSHHLELPFNRAGNSSLPIRLSGLSSRTTSPYVKIEKSLGRSYDDGGPGPDEPKAVLPEPM